MLSETRLDSRDPKTGYQPKGVTRGTNIPGALSDVLATDGTSVFLRHRRFDRNGKPQPSDVPHLFSPAGFLDDAWWHRTYWMVGTRIGTNYGGWPRPGNQVPAGRLLVVDGATVYGFGRSTYVHHGSHVGIDGATVFHFRGPRDAKTRQTHYRLFAATYASGPKPPAKGRRAARPKRTFLWTQRLPILARAMVLADTTLFVAGPPHFLEPADKATAPKGARLLAMSAADGKALAEHALDAGPVFDGMAAAGGRLYLSTLDGKVLCFAGKP
jgi:hypothetical protein